MIAPCPLQESTDHFRCHDADSIFRSYLEIAPFALAIFRASELAPLGERILARPVLDLGCGTGDVPFSLTEFPLDAGVDRSKPRMRIAAKRASYKTLTEGNAERMPCADNEFETILCISVLEHICNPLPVLAEAYRVLQPGGEFIASIVLEDIHAHLASIRFLEWCRLRPVASLVAQAHDRVFSHVCLRPGEFWVEGLREAGFEITSAHKTVSKRTMFWFELALLTAWPYRIALAAGREWAWRPRWMTRLLYSFFRNKVSRGSSVGGACLFVSARKPDVNSVPLATGTTA